MVLATDSATGKTEAERVTALWVNHDADLMDVTVKTAGGISVIKSTQHHLFWDPSTHSWVQADNLGIGTALQTQTGATANVVATTIVPGAAYMWDLTVNNDHDFYVSVGAGSLTAVLVHNINVPCGGSVPDESDLGQAVGRGAHVTRSFNEVASNLEDNNGLTLEQASENLHSIKSLSDNNPDVFFTRSGGVYDQTSGDLLGNLLDG
jgi:Pretoxin HINT domain